MENKPDDVIDRMRHSCSHLLAAAILNLYPDTKLAIGPTIENGFYYDFEFVKPISEGDLTKIEEEMIKIQKGWDKFERFDKSVSDAKEFEKNQPYKLELINELSKEGNSLSFYKSGDFTDLCKGPHVENARDIGPFKLLSIAGAYWKGDEKNKMLTRIYGTAFETQKELDNYLWQQEEAKKRDHRKLGLRLELFKFEDIAPGAPFWYPKGMIIIRELEKLWRDIHEEKGYQEISTPIMVKNDLFKTSGHWEYYQHLMFNLSVLEDEEIEIAKKEIYDKTLEIADRALGIPERQTSFPFEILIKGKPTKVDILLDRQSGKFSYSLPVNYTLKPMNCPESTYIYSSKSRSYRDLPLRLSEIGRLHRREKSGELGGLLRVRQLTMDDAHIYTSVDRMRSEIELVIDLTTYFYNLFNFVPTYHLSTRPEKFMGERLLWDTAEQKLTSALNNKKLKYQVKEGEGAFYGPKIDVDITDAIGRNWQLATIQLDFQMPKRFNLTYIDKDGMLREPVMIHRAIFGSFERFIGILIEHYAGAFPVWLSPTQVMVIPISEKNNSYAQKIANLLKSNNIRYELNDKNETMQAKIREATLQKIPYMCIIGDREEKESRDARIDYISIRIRNGKDLGKTELNKFLVDIKKEIENKL